VPVAKKVLAKLQANLKALHEYQQKIKRKVVNNMEVRCGSKINRIRRFNWFTKKMSEDYEVEKEGVNFP